MPTVRMMITGVLLGLFLIYITSYITLSRHGFAMADEYEFAGFYFFEPENTDAWRRANYSLVLLYYPLIVIDNAIGTGRPVAADPTAGLSLRDPEQSKSPARLNGPCGGLTALPIMCVCGLNPKRPNNC